MGIERVSAFFNLGNASQRQARRVVVRAFALSVAAIGDASAAAALAPPGSSAQIPAPLVTTQQVPPAGQAPAAAPGASASLVARQWMEGVTANAQAGLPKGRLSIEVGELDARLKLAPCARIEPYLPAGQRAWGKVKVGLRCVSGPVAWNVFLPVTVRIWAPAVVTTGPVAAETELRASDLTLAEVDRAERPAPTFDRVEDLLGRKTAVALSPGATVRADVLKMRQWFGAGETVAIVAVGAGFSIASEAQALSPGLDGQPVKLRTESGRIITAMPVGERRAELRL